MKKIIITIFTGILIFCAQTIFAQPGSLDSSFGIGGKVITDVGGEGHLDAIAIQADGKIIGGGSSAGFPNFLVIRYQTNGNPDTTFGTDGRAHTDFGESANSGTVAESVALQADGKIIAAGYTFDYSTRNSALVAARYLPNGNPDSSFGNNGKIIDSFGLSSGISSIAIQPDGKIVMAGSAETSSNFDFLVVRYLPNGNLDSSFGSNGKVFTDFTGGDNGVRSIAIQTDGKILTGGFAYDQNNIYQKFALARYKVNGNLDSAFGTNGKVTTIWLPDLGSDEITSVALQTDNKIVAGGFTLDADSVATGSPNFAVARYKTNGSLDSGFGTNGRVITIFSDEQEGRALTLQTDGKIVISGYAATLDNSDSADFALARYETDGSIDAGFGTNGKVTTHFDRNENIDSPLAVQNICTSIALQANGKIVAAGYSLTYGSSGVSNTNLVLARYNNDGSLPITLTSFTAAKNGKNVLLNWQTANEINNNYFSVERSANGASFSEIGIVKSKGNSNQLQRYAFTDLSPLSNENYYRLKQIDVDGHFTYSDIVYVSFDIAKDFRLYPNPVKDILKINGLSSSDKSTISIIDISGRIIQRATTANSSYVINVQKLKPGSYYVQISSNNKITTLKFIKE